MKYISLGLISVGALIISYSIYAYHHTLQYMKEQNYDRKVFNQWVYRASFMMMVFFLFGYIGVGIALLTGAYQPYSFLISAIFFFGAIFVLFMVNVQRMLSETITEKTVQTIQSMVRTMETKDIYTRGHSEHVRNLSVLIYKHLPDELKREINLVNLRDAAMLHDIGKIGIPDEVLNKPGKLTPEEFNIITSHPRNGKAILEGTCYRDISQWVLYHHERFDGNGYYKVPEEMIPIESRIICIADIFSALYTDRVYRKRFSYEEAIERIRQESGKALDPVLTEIFCSIEKEEIDGASVCVDFAHTAYSE